MPAEPDSDPAAQGGALTSPQHPLLLFYDGDCSFCARWIARVIEADRHQRARFSTLQGRTFQQVAARRPDLTKRTSVVLVSRRRDGREEIFTRSTAIRKLINGLPGFRFFAFVLHVVPRPLNDLGYWIVAQLREVLFGRWATCRPNFDQQKEGGLFLD